MTEQQDNVSKAVEAINAALDVLPDVLQFVEERKAQSAMTTDQILARAGARFGENELSLLADLARLKQQTEG
jgi:hypothetical protein